MGYQCELKEIWKYQDDIGYHQMNIALKVLLEAKK
jgi:hypothetical protein